MFLLEMRNDLHSILSLSMGYLCINFFLPLLHEGHHHHKSILFVMFIHIISKGDCADAFIVREMVISRNLIMISYTVYGGLLDLTIMVVWPGISALSFGTV